MGPVARARDRFARFALIFPGMGKIERFTGSLPPAAATADEPPMLGHDMSLGLIDQPMIWPLCLSTNLHQLPSSRRKNRKCNP